MYERIFEAASGRLAHVTASTITDLKMQLSILAQTTSGISTVLGGGTRRACETPNADTVRLAKPTRQSIRTGGLTHQRSMSQRTSL